jgi:hypothetical protein
MRASVSLLAVVALLSACGIHNGKLTQVTVVFQIASQPGN